MTSSKNTGRERLTFSGVAYESLYAEINRLRKRDGLEPMGGLHFALKLHDHVLVEPNMRVAEALRNLEPPKEKEKKAGSSEAVCQL